MGTAIDFEKLAQDLAFARMALRERVEALEAAIAAMKKHDLPAIRKWAGNAAEKQQALHQAITDYPECFVKPRTKIMHGIRFGWQKSKGEITWENEEQVIKLIRKHLPDQAEVLIKCKETPVKSALAQLPAADLKKLGVSVENDTDEVLIKFTDSEIDKIVNAILATEDTGE